jgi:hypothetical protein
VPILDAGVDHGDPNPASSAVAEDVDLVEAASERRDLWCQGTLDELPAPRR